MVSVKKRYNTNKNTNKHNRLKKSYTVRKNQYGGSSLFKSTSTSDKIRKLQTAASRMDDKGIEQPHGASGEKGYFKDLDNHKIEHLKGVEYENHKKAVDKMTELARTNPADFAILREHISVKGVTDGNGKYKLYLVYEGRDGQDKYLTPDGIDEVLAFARGGMTNPTYALPSQVVQVGGVHMKKEAWKRGAMDEKQVKHLTFYQNPKNSGEIKLPTRQKLSAVNETRGFKSMGGNKNYRKTKINHEKATRVIIGNIETFKNANVFGSKIFPVLVNNKTYFLDENHNLITFNGVVDLLRETTDKLQQARLYGSKSVKTPEPAPRKFRQLPIEENVNLPEELAKNNENLYNKLFRQEAQDVKLNPKTMTIPAEISQKIEAQIKKEEMQKNLNTNSEEIEKKIKEKTENELNNFKEYVAKMHNNLSKLNNTELTQLYLRSINNDKYFGYLPYNMKQYFLRTFQKAFTNNAEIDGLSDFKKAIMNQYSVIIDNELNNLKDDGSSYKGFGNIHDFIPPSRISAEEERLRILQAIASANNYETVANFGNLTTESGLPNAQSGGTLKVYKNICKSGKNMKNMKNMKTIKNMKK